MKQANANVLAAWQEGNPNFPPRFPLTKCTMSAIFGLRDGRGRSNIGRRRELHVWSANAISKANIKVVKMTMRIFMFLYKTYRMDA